MLRGVARGGTTMLLITHHIEEILPEIGRIVMLRGGKLFRDGAKAELLTSEALSGLFDLPMAVTARGEWFDADLHPQSGRSEEPTSELQSLMRIPYAVS